MTVIKFAPMGDPMELQIHGYELTLRLADADQITIEQISSRTRKHEGARNINQSVHPGLGEEGKYHVKRGWKPFAGKRRGLHMRWWEIRIVERRRCLTS